MATRNVASPLTEAGLRAAIFGDGVTFIGAADNGDLVVVPAGTITLTQQCNILKAITIQGNGQGSTVFNSSIGPTGSLKGLFRFAVTVDPKSAAVPYTWGMNNLTINFTGNTFVFWMDGATSGTPSPQLLGISQNLRHHHLTITGSGVPNLMFIQDIIGLIDHCTLSQGALGQIMDVYHPHWPNSDNTAADWGHGSYQNPVPWGTDKFLYMEDCDITNVGKAVTDSYDGGRFVVRHCTLHGTSGVTNHGTESHGGARGCRAVEEYNNWCLGLTTVPESRSGTFLCFNNIVNGQSGTATIKRLQNHRDTLIKDLGGTFGRNPTYLGFPFAYISNPTVDQNTPLADPGQPPSITNEPITGNISPILFTGKATSAIAANTSGTFTCTNEDGSPIVGWSATTGGPIGDGTWKTLSYFPSTFDYDDSAGFNYVVENASHPPSDGATAAGPAIIDSNGAASLTVSSNLGNNNSKSFFIGIGDTFTIRAVYGPLDMPGRGPCDKSAVQKLAGWPHQILDPNYEWNNWNGATIGAGSKTSWRVTEGIFLADRDFFIDTVKPGYPQIGSPTTAQRTVGASLSPSGTLLGTGDVYGYAYPHPLTGAALGKILDVGGPMLFGNVIIGQAPVITRPIGNDGDASITVTSINYSNAKFTGSGSGFTIAPGATHDLDVTYTPTVAGLDTGTITVVADEDSGTDNFTATGTGVEEAGGGGHGKGHKKGVLVARGR